MAETETEPDFDALAWEHALDEFPGADPDDIRVSHAYVTKAIMYGLNPPDDDAAFESVLVAQLTRAVGFILAQPCTCKPGDDDGACDRCDAVGRWHNEVVGR